MSSSRAALLGLALALGGACSDGPCARHSDCAPSQVCTIDGVCAARPGGSPADAAEVPDADAPGADLRTDASAAPDASTAVDAATRGGGAE
jgi:hypothetical protein